jgi:RNA polymerase sigma factor (sigma-70 family)
MTENELSQVLQGCRDRKQASQYRLYSQFYNYAMSIARRYVNAVYESEEIVNDAFYKVFTKIEQYSYENSFKAWLRRIVVNTSIDYIRAQKRLPQISDLEHFEFETEELEADLIAAMTKTEVLGLVNQLPPAYRTVFNMYVVDELSHDEIADLLHISAGTSKSNLARARQHLKRIIIEHEGKIKYT